MNEKRFLPDSREKEEKKEKASFVLGVIAICFSALAASWSFFGGICCGWAGWPLAFVGMVLAIISLVFKRGALGYCAAGLAVFSVAWICIQAFVLTAPLSGQINKNLKNNFTVYQCKSKQMEAKQTLTQIGSSQKAYFTKNGTYADDLKKLNLNIVQNHYEYFLEKTGNKQFKAIAKSKAPGIGNKGAGDDIWTIDQSLAIKNSVRGCR